MNSIPMESKSVLDSCHNNHQSPARRLKKQKVLQVLLSMLDGAEWRCCHSHPDGSHEVTDHNQAIESVTEISGGGWSGD